MEQQQAQPAVLEHYCPWPIQDSQTPRPLISTTGCRGTKFCTRRCRTTSLRYCTDVAEVARIAYTYSNDDGSPLSAFKK